MNFIGLSFKGVAKRYAMMSVILNKQGRYSKDWRLLKDDYSSFKNLLDSLVDVRSDNPSNGMSGLNGFYFCLRRKFALS